MARLGTSDRPLRVAIVGSIKAVTRVLDQTLADPRVRFFGNVTFGVDLHHHDLKRLYYASYADWRVLDAHEVALGGPQGRPRVAVPEMMEAIRRGR